MRYKIIGMTCSACAVHIEKAVKKINATAQVSVNLLGGTMDVSDDTPPNQIISAIKKAGYSASLLNSRADGSASPQSNESVLPNRGDNGNTLVYIRLRLIFSAFFTAVLMYFSMGHMLGLPLPEIFHTRSDIGAVTQLLLTIPVIALNYSYFTNGFYMLIKRAPNMNSLVACGAGAAVIYGIYAVYSLMLGKTAELYFESAAMILTLVTLGKYLEAGAKGKANDAVGKLIGLAPKSAEIERDGQLFSIPSKDLKVGDTVIIKSGASVPCDGTVVAGSASVNESAVTGESIPVAKNVGDKVIGGTVNAGGYIKFRAESVGNDTALAKIIRLVEDAASSKAPISKLADRVSGVFVPIVLSIAFITAIIWSVFGKGAEFALSAAVSTLVISCPCALGLATPTAITVGTGRGAMGGILIKSGEALETLHKIKVMVLDKTGTVTEGKMILDQVYPCLNITESEIISVAGALEAMSEHPIAKAVTSAVKTNNIAAADYENIPGRGISGYIDGTKYYIGNKALADDLNIKLQPDVQDRLNEYTSCGKTVLLLSRSEYNSEYNKDENVSAVLLGILAVSDKIKDDSAAAVKELIKMGIKPILLTGDNKRAADSVAQSVGISDVIAEVMPADKAEVIKNLKKDGIPVAMVGDGVNDAPALVTADIGIAISAGTDAAVESADVVLMKNSIYDAVNAVRLSRASMRIIRENLFWALVYNIICIPAAAGILYPAFGILLNPMIAAAAMSLSSLCVVTNALRLKTFKFISADISSHQQFNNKNVKGKNNMNEFNYSITIEGMTCSHCTGRVEKALSEIKNVTAASVDLDSKTASVTASKAIDAKQFVKTVSSVGYNATSVQ